MPLDDAKLVDLDEKVTVCTGAAAVDRITGRTLIVGGCPLPVEWHAISYER